MFIVSDNTNIFYKYSMFGAFMFCGCFMVGVGCCFPGFYDNKDLKSKEVAKEAAIQGAAAGKKGAELAYDNRHLLNSIETTDNENNNQGYDNQGYDNQGYNNQGYDNQGYNNAG